MRISPHAHIESPLTGSTVKNMVKRAKELGRTHFTCTDNGHLSSALKAYGLAKKEGLKFIPGIEVYFKDTTCNIVAGTPADRCKYFTISLYCQDQDAYQNLCKIISGDDFPTTEINQEVQQLWTWSHLERAAKHNVVAVLGGIHCMVGKTFLAGKPDLGEKVLLKLNNIFKDRLSTSLLCEPWLKKWNSIVEINYDDGTRDTLLASDSVTTNRARNIRAIDLVGNDRHGTVESKSVSNISYDVGKIIKSTKLHKGFLPLPGGDAIQKVNKFLKALANRHKIPILVTDYAYYAKKEDKLVQTMRLEGNNKLQPNLHMKSEEEIIDYLTESLGIPVEEAVELIANNDRWAAGFDKLKLDYQWRLADPGGDALKMIMEIIKKNGRMKWDDPKYVERLQMELKVIAKNPVKDLSPYFLPIRDMLQAYQDNGYLTGPGRGSAGGALLNYCLGITHIDPFKYNLPFERFFSLDRILLKKLPDIDVDLEDRTPLVGEDGRSGFLYDRWGDKAAQISTRTTIRLKSAVKDTNRYFNGHVEPAIEKFSEGLPAPPQGISDLNFVFGFEDDDGNHIEGLIEASDALKNYVAERPNEWEIVQSAMGLTRAFSRHASAFVLSDVPIKDLVPTKDGNITQYEAKECESAGLIKYDFLVVNQVKDIRVCLDYINKKNNEKHTVGYFSHNGDKTFVWDLPQDADVYKSVWGGATESIFQISTRSMTPFVMDILPDKMMDLADILGVVRPGPMDAIDPATGRTMAEEYVARRKGLSSPAIKEMYDVIPETHGILIYQEQLGKIAKELAGFPGDRAEILRENMAKKRMEELMKMKPDFMAGATQKVGAEIAESIWDQMVTFGRYGFSIIHAVEYAHITYACMFLKHYYPLEWWAAILTNADEKEITGKFWPYVRDIFLPPDINLSGDQMAIDYANGKIRAKLGVIRGMGDKTIEPIVANRPYADIQNFVNKEVAGASLTRKLIHVGVLDSLFPPKLSFEEKLQMFEDSYEVNQYNKKVANATAERRKFRGELKKGSIPEEWLNIGPMDDACRKKAVLPSFPINLYDLGKRFSKVKAKDGSASSVMSSNGYATPLINGDSLQRLDEVGGEKVVKDIYVASTCFVVEAKEFAFAKNTKRALKLILDADGYTSEKVLWPDYHTGQLIYPQDLKKGKIITVFLKKRPNKKDMSVMNIVVEA